MMFTFAFIIFLIAQRLVELFIADRNTRRLLANGGIEFAPAHYPFIIAVHSLWILSIVYFGWDQPVQLGWLAVYAILQIFRLWILSSLGKRWTTRIIVLNEPLVRRGPYRFVDHPNYILVAAEIIVAPMVLGLFSVAAIFTFLNAAILTVRIQAEEKALETITDSAE